MLKKFIAFVLVISLICTMPTISLASPPCYTLYNITLGGETNASFAIKMPYLESYSTNCEVEGEYLNCSGKFYFYGVSKPYSKPFEFKDVPFKHVQGNCSKAYCEKAFELTSGSKTLMDAILNITTWVYESIYYSQDEKSPELTFETKSGNCESISKLTVSMLNSIGIESRVVYGWKSGEPHSWIEVNYSNSWLPVDPTFGRYGYLGPDYTLLGYSKARYMYSTDPSEPFDYNFNPVEQRECQLKLRKRGPYLYNPHRKILTYKENKYGSWPFIVTNGYIKSQEINGIGYEEDLKDKVIGFFLYFKSFLNREFA